MAQQDEIVEINFTLEADPVPVADGFVPPPGYWFVAPYKSVRVFGVAGSDNHCRKIMQEHRHPNILRMESFTEHLLLVQRYSGDLQSYIETLLDSPSIEDITQCLQTAFRGVFNGIAYLINHDLYHGNFSLSNTYYCMQQSHPMQKLDAVVKLANFKSWDFGIWNCNLTHIWSEDWALVGQALDIVAAMVVKHIGSVGAAMAAEMRELARVLKDGNIEPSKKNAIALEQVFFWDPVKRAAVYTCTVPRLLLNPDFYAIAANNFKFPHEFSWDKDNSFKGLLKIMNDFRETHHKTRYRGTKKIHYLKFVIGSYTHENEFKLLYNMWGPVDRIFRRCDPEMSLNLVKVLKAFEAEQRKGKT